MEFIEYIKHKAKMVKMDSDGECGINCVSCPLGGLNNGKEMYCLSFERSFPDLAVKIVEDWVKENSTEE